MEPDMSFGFHDETRKLMRLWKRRSPLEGSCRLCSSNLGVWYIEAFIGKLRDELIDREIFTTLLEAKVLIENWRKEYNQVRPHSSLGYRPPAPEAIQPALAPTTLT